VTNTTWPRWLVPNWVSKPSAVVSLGAGHDTGVGDHEVAEAPSRPLATDEPQSRAIPHLPQRRFQARNSGEKPPGGGTSG
jgi:hypothetical protein